MDKENLKEVIINQLSRKALTKQDVYIEVLSIFNDLKKVLQEIVEDYNKDLIRIDERLLLEYTDKGSFEAELKVAGDVLVFIMHSNVFNFDKNHSIRKMSYVSNDELVAFSGVINIYNFLSDSFKYNRMEDLGYLVARMFINKDKHFFVEGKRQLGFLYNNFEKAIIDKKALREIVETSMKYVLDFDLLVPPYEKVKLATVGQVHKKINDSKTITGKRLGFQFKSDDV